jgi:hypothetical protein
MASNVLNFVRYRLTISFWLTLVGVTLAVVGTAPEALNGNWYAFRTISWSLLCLAWSFSYSLLLTKKRRR